MKEEVSIKSVRDGDVLSEDEKAEAVQETGGGAGVQIAENFWLLNGRLMKCAVEGKLLRVYRRVIDADTMPFTLE